MQTSLNKSQILGLFSKLNSLLLFENVTGELYLVGGAVMSLVYDQRSSTRDLDGVFRPASVIRRLAKIIAEENDLPLDWLNDGVKGFLSENSNFNNFLELSNLKVFVADSKYLLAMKCLAFRIGAEFQDEKDIAFLLRYLNIESYLKAFEIITLYYPLERFPQKTLYALEEMLERNV